MRHKDPELMNRILEFVTAYVLDNHHSPSMGAISKAFNISRSSAHRYLTAMNEKGLLIFSGDSIDTPQTESIFDASRAEVFEDAIPCGPADEIEAAAEAYVSLPSYIFGKDDMCVIRTKGYSMVNAGIEPGDYVVVKKTNQAAPGDIVVALCQNANTLKRLLCDENGEYILHPENNSMEDLHVQDLQIQGVATFVIKQLK